MPEGVPESRSAAFFTAERDRCFRTVGINKTELEPQFMTQLFSLSCLAWVSRSSYDPGGKGLDPTSGVSA